MATTINPQSGLNGVGTVPWGQLKSSTAFAAKSKKDMNPDTNWGLGTARVININYVEMFVTLRTLTGAASTFDRVPVPLTFPGAGTRHFFGAMPEIGDVCVVGWMPPESMSSSTTGTRTPIILSWLIPGVWPGQDWVTTSDFDPDEYDINNPKDQQALRGVYSQIRHKLRHIQPGNIVASSSQGSDMVLDEGVTLANRRGNEIRLRDADQALVVRSLQQFHAMAGTRIYAGMVQRDARLLPAMCVSDGREWDSKTQALAGVAIDDSHLSADLLAGDGFYTPSKLFQRRQLTTAEGDLAGQPFPVSSYLDPYKFLQRGGFIDDAGYVLDANHIPAVSDAVYGGKPFFRVANQGLQNTVNEIDTPTLTEYRVELAHTSDGRLPVTEQTDMFDAERLLETNPDIPGAISTNTPFIEFVLGSVVGNDPYSTKGREGYGLPVVPIIFDGETPAPRLEPAKITDVADGSTPTPMKDQAAMLFRMAPPTAEPAAPTFWAVNKQGQYRGYIGGEAKEDSVHLYAQGNMKIGSGGRVDIYSLGGVHFHASGKASMELMAPEGAVTIYGGGPIKTAETTVERASGTGGGEGDVPSVDIGAKTNIRLQAEKKILLKSNNHETQATNVKITGHEKVEINGTKTISETTENYQLSVSSQASESYSGPKYSLPTNYPLHERVYTSQYPGFTGEKISYQMCDREEEFKILGNHSTTMQVGDMTYETLLGKWSATALVNSFEVDSTSGITGQAKIGNVALKALVGTATVSGMATATLEATAGIATVRGGVGVILAAPITGPDSGPIICAGSLEPFTNLPFATWGMGAKMHNVTA